MGLRTVSRRGPIAPAGLAGPGNALPLATASAPGAVVLRSQSKPADLIYDQILAQIEPASAVHMTRPELAARVEQLVVEIANQRRLLLNQQEQQTLAAAMVDDMIGLGPLEVLLRDDTISDILVNSPHQIYVQRRGKLVLTDLRFRNNLHVLHVAQRIASAVGRRVDESSPMLDARLADGQPGQCRHPASQPQGTVHLDPQVHPQLSRFRQADRF
jgi:pilus assembly protein CpaF